ncbi:hypothetical protein FRB94_007945 [Tulasnella sp. JGI-2019a]|nr:hypothetical protein FRB94_007945 [Tulasnella sp. JGI-2019a]
MARLFFKPATIAVACAYFTGVTAQAAAWAQCGGIGFTGPTTCVTDWCCIYLNPYHSQCLQYNGCPNTLTATATGTTTAAPPMKTLFADFNWLRSSVEPYEYLQSINSNAAGAAILGNSTTAGQFTLDGQQIAMWIPQTDTFQYGNVQPPVNSSQTYLPVIFGPTTNGYGYAGLNTAYNLQYIVSSTGKALTFIMCKNNLLYATLGEFQLCTTHLDS